MKRVRFNFGETPFKFMDADSSSRTRTRGRYCASTTTTNQFKNVNYKVFLLYFFLVANCVKKCKYKMEMEVKELQHFPCPPQ